MAKNKQNSNAISGNQEETSQTTWLKGLIPFRVIKCALCVHKLRTKQRLLKNRAPLLIRIGIKGYLGSERAY